MCNLLQSKEGGSTEKECKTAAEEALADVYDAELTEVITDCLMSKKNEVLQELLGKMARRIERRASRLSSGLSEPTTRDAEVGTQK